MLESKKNKANANSKAIYESVEKDIQERLYLLFSEAYRQNIGTIIVIEGFAGSGKGSLMKAITCRLDPRKLQVHSVDLSDHIYKDFPPLYQFWQKLPAFGELTIFEGSWYRKTVYERFYKIIREKEYSYSVRSIQNFEELICQDRYLLFKFFLDISSKEQKKRFEKAKKEGKDWVISKEDLEEAKYYKSFRKYYEELIGLTNTPATTWDIIPAKDKYFCRLHIMEKLIERLESNLQFDSQEMLSRLKEKEPKEI
jgi:polyphosphate kinase 2 (PPK2 family)